MPEFPSLPLLGRPTPPGALIVITAGQLKAFEGSLPSGLPSVADTLFTIGVRIGNIFAAPQYGGESFRLASIGRSGYRSI